MTRPTHWYGTDAPEGGIELDWDLIEVVAKDIGAGPDADGAIALYNWLCSLAIEAREEGQMEECSALASYGVAALNYWVEGGLFS